MDNKERRGGKRVKRLNKEEIDRLKDGSIIYIVDYMDGYRDKDKEQFMYRKEGDILYGIDTACRSYHIEDLYRGVDRGRLAVFRRTVPIEELKRCVEVLNRMYQIVGVHVCDKSKEHAKGAMARELAMDIMKKGYLVDGYSIRYEWSEYYEDKVDKYNYRDRMYFIKLSAYVIKDIE